MDPDGISPVARSAPGGPGGQGRLASDLESLYEVLLEKVLPTYYDDPDRWEAMMRESISTTSEPFAIKRMLDDYYSKMYRVDPA